MSELNDGFFSRLAQKMPGFKRQVAKAQGNRVNRNGACCGKKPCGLCGKFFGPAFGTKPQTELYCPACQGSLDKGCGAFVTLEKPARYWIGKGVKPELAGRVTVISALAMDAVLRAEEELKAQESADAINQKPEQS